MPPGVGKIEMLSRQEIERANRFRMEQDRRRFINRHVMLRVLLARCTGRNAGGIQIRYGTYGKPFLSEQGADRSIHFSTAHSAGTAVVAIGMGFPIGVDIEEVKMLKEMEEIVARHFTAEERRVFRNYSGFQRVEVFYRFWVRKEAVLKASGEGLIRPTTEIDVSVWPVESKRAVDPAPHSAEQPSMATEDCSRTGNRGKGSSPRCCNHWAAYDLDFMPGFAAAIGTMEPCRGIRCRHFPEQLLKRDEFFTDC
jgi:phosphopantetheinyl transferase